MTESGLRGAQSPPSLPSSLVSSLYLLPSFFPSFLLLFHGLGLLILLTWGTFETSLIWAWSPSHLIPMHCFLLPIQATPLICFMCIVFIFMNLEKSLFLLPARHCALRSYHVVPCVCYMYALRVRTRCAAESSRATDFPAMSPCLPVTLSHHGSMTASLGSLALSQAKNTQPSLL